MVDPAGDKDRTSEASYKDEGLDASHSERAREQGRPHPHQDGARDYENVPEVWIGHPKKRERERKQRRGLNLVRKNRGSHVAQAGPQNVPVFEQFISDDRNARNEV